MHTYSHTSPVFPSLQGAIHVLLSLLMLVGWLAVPGRVYLGSMKSANVSRYRLTVDDSPYRTLAVFEKRKRKTRFSSLLLYLRLARNSSFLSHFTYFLISLAGFAVSPMFFAVELFALAYRVNLFNVRVCLCVAALAYCNCVCL